jgi:DNA sulfur modification protein DndE
MQSPVDTIHVGAFARERLIQLKRHTKIDNWNILSRWGYCLGLLSQGIPLKMPEGEKSNTEMTWRTFAGEYDELLSSVTRIACLNATGKCTPKMLETFFYSRLDYGILLLGRKRQEQSIDELIVNMLLRYDLKS